ncbi:MAG: hypothetical protein ACLFS3_00535 [Candidatus Aenigmatarchaeota archaeon]
MPTKTPIKKIDASSVKKKKDFKTFSEEVGPNLDPRARSMCLKCRGVKKLCGKEKCPVLVKYYSQLDEEKQNKFDTDFIEGNSPPAVFIGRYGYPKVNVGPLVPPEKGDTSIYSQPERWYGKKDINDIVKMRGGLVRGKKRLKTDVKIKNEDLNRDIEEVRYLTLSKRPAETEVKFRKRLSETMRLDGESQPHGPSAAMESFRRGSMTGHKQLEKVFYDKDLKSVKGVTKLYNKGVSVSKIQELFMVGGTGTGKDRKFVPTRWSITAVDDILGKDLREDIKDYPLVNQYQTYSANYLDNEWLIILTPESWRYEMIEAFYPETTWNPSSGSIAIFGDHEEYEGRSDYASIGGCYYSGRLAITEKLDQMKRQAGAIVLREAKPGYILPVGVWNVRESIRHALQEKPRKFGSRQEMMNFIDKKMDLSLNQWKSVSRLLNTKRTQKSLKDFLNNQKWSSNTSSSFRT